jgi:sec-independent protein translocase protein TatA
MFGAKKLPEAARSLGRSARILKSEISSLHDDVPPSGDMPLAPVSAVDAMSEKSQLRAPIA